MLRIRDVYPGSHFFPSRIRTVSIPDRGSASKNLSILTPKKTKKWFLSSRKYDKGCSSRIPDPDADFLPIADPGSRGQKGTESRIQGSKRHRIPDPDPQHCRKFKKLTLVRSLTAAFSVQISLQNNSCLSVLKFSESKYLINICFHMLSL